MKKIFVSLFTIFAVVAATSGATQAVFSDTETSTGNTFAAGTLDLTVDGENDPNVVAMSFAGIEPGFSENHTWILKNNGSVAGQPSVTFSVISNLENECTEPEDGDTTCGDDQGELGSKLYAQMSWRTPGSGSWNSMRLTNSCGNPLLNGLGGQTVGLGSLTGCGTDNALPILNENEEVEVRFHPWWHLTATDNLAQGDGVEFDISFELNQV